MLKYKKRCMKLPYQACTSAALYFAMLYIDLIIVRARDLVYCV